MFPHTITIYRHSIVNNQDVYTKQTLSGFYIMPSKSFTSGDKSLEKTTPTTIVSNPENALKYGTEWDIQAGDRIVKGVGGDITALKQLINAIEVTSVQENVCGSAVDNIVITGV